MRQKISGQGLAFIVGGGSGTPSEFHFLLQKFLWPFRPLLPASLVHVDYVVKILNIPPNNLTRERTIDKMITEEHSNKAKA